jgi:hypothetical protein
MQQEKISTAERSWTNPLNALLNAIHYSFIKFCIYCFSLWYEFFVHYHSSSQFWTVTSRHILPSPFRLKIVNTTQNRLIDSEPHSHKPFAPVLVFVMDRLALKQNFMAYILPSMTYKEN